MRRALSVAMVVCSLFASLPASVRADQPKSATETMTPVEPSKPSRHNEISKAHVPNHPRQVLKNGSDFLVMNDRGGVDIKENIGAGLYRDDTRYLSDWEIKVDGAPLSILSADCDPGYSGRFLYGNKALNDAHSAPEQSILIQRDVVVIGGMRERYTLTNFGTAPAKVTIAIRYGADFADMFEVRGMPRKRRGEYQEAVIDPEKQTVILPYKGLDGITMRTVIGFSKMKPVSLTEEFAKFECYLQPRDVKALETAVITNCGEPLPDVFDDPSVPETQRKYSFHAQSHLADEQFLSWFKEGGLITTDNDDFNRLLQRSYRDLYMLRQPTPRGECLAAGIPWFTVAFGRDQEITSREMLAVMPQLAKEVLAILAEYQGTKDDPYTEEHPGKIMHELRLGEMARTKEIPFIPYYGTVDATPLWLGLLERYIDWTGDLDFARKYWPNAQRALAFLDSQTVAYPYLTYGEKKGAALSNQGWKDSADSVMYADGTLVKPPVALCEVQGYLYDAWIKSARLADLLGHKEEAEKLRQKADSLKSKFQSDFWSPDTAYFAIALDGSGKRCDVISSNPGHLLSTGILTDAQAKAVADHLMAPEMYCGWGIRTLSALEQDYNPLSYHDGSVWPHDNAMIVEGMSSINRKKDAATILGAIFEVSRKCADIRLPELFCGFSKTYSDKPVWYPVSCSPQAWAAASPFMMLTNLLGLHADALNNKLTISKPMLPDWLHTVNISGLHMGNSTVNLHFSRQDDGTTCSVTAKRGDVNVVVEQ